MVVTDKMISEIDEGSIETFIQSCGLSGGERGQRLVIGLRGQSVRVRGLFVREAGAPETNNAPLLHVRLYVPVQVTLPPKLFGADAAFVFLYA